MNTPNDAVPADTAADQSPAPRRGLALVDAALLPFVAAALRSRITGRVHLTLPSGRSALVGPSEHEVAADLRVHSYRVLWQSLRRGTVGFADSYIAGDIGTRDLDRLFNFFLDNEQALATAGKGLFRREGSDRRLHRRRANTRAGSRRNIAAHYDLGNEFYRHWLDEDMTYSSGIYRTPTDTLETAQRTKYERILAALDLRPEHRLLEIGCGWGALARAAGDCARSVTALTISAQQLSEARARIEAAGLKDKVDIRFEDYRDTSGTFDRIASVEMIEAVGAENWPTYFDVLSKRLKSGGCAVIQAITINPEIYESYRRNPDFIQRYIFPGGMLPREEDLRWHGATSGLAYDRIETFSGSYALTLAEWRKRFIAAWPRIAAQGFDERFRRTWLYYLAYCQVGFERGMIDVGLYRFSKPPASVGSSEHVVEA